MTAALSGYEKELRDRAEFCFYYQGVSRLTDSDLRVLREFLEVCRNHRISGPVQRYAFGETQR